VGEKFGKDQAAQQACQPGTRDLAFDLPACPLHQIAEFHVRWTRGFAGAAIEAELHVIDKARRHGQALFFYRFDQVDAPAWRIHLCP
jgi:hypothetical protein